MSLLTKMRIRQARWGRPTLALVMFAWLNVILQPCAMAMAGSVCPHCPPERMHAQPAHAMADHGHSHAMPDHEHGGEHATSQGQQSDPGSDECAGDLSGCANLDDLRQNDRIKPFSADLKLVGLAPPPERCTPTGLLRHSTIAASLDSARLSGAYPPLNVLYCVYLD